MPRVLRRGYISEIARLVENILPLLFAVEEAVQGKVDRCYQWRCSGRPRMMTTREDGS